MSFILLFLSLHNSISLLFHFCARHLLYSPTCTKTGNCCLQLPLGSCLISPSELFYSSFTSFLHIIYLVSLICKSTMFMFIHLYICHVSYNSVFLLSLLYCISLNLPVYICFILLTKTEFFLLFLPTSASISFNFSNYIYIILVLCISLLLFPSKMEIYPFPFLYISICIPINIIIF
jgi:hypothetical protein